MTIRLALAPLWFQLLANIAIGCGMWSLALVFWRPADPEPLRGHLGWWIAVGIGGVLLGMLVTATGWQARAEIRSAVEGIAPQDHQIIAKAVVRGPFPVDPALSSAVIRVAGVYLVRAKRLKAGAGLLLSAIIVWSGLAVLEAFNEDSNPAIFILNIPTCVCYAVQIFYVIPLIEARRALMLNVQGDQPHSLAG